MAGTTGPLFSLEASGTVGKTITYSRWKGRSYVRRRVIPLNPFTADQVAARNMVRAAGVTQNWVKNTLLKTTPPGERDELAIRGVTPDGFAWNGFLVQKLIGENADNYAAAQALWAAFTTEKAAWNGAADDLVPAMQPAPQDIAGGLPGTALTNGNVFFLLRYALYTMGLVAVPGATPPTYS